MWPQKNQMDNWTIMKRNPVQLNKKAHFIKTKVTWGYTQKPYINLKYKNYHTKFFVYSQKPASRKCFREFCTRILIIAYKKNMTSHLFCMDIYFSWFEIM